MKLLLDECVPRSFKNYLPEHECHTVPEAGLAGKKNGELLSLAEQAGFQVILTVDRGIEYEQNLRQLGIAVILVRSRSSRLVDLLPHVAEILSALSSIERGRLVRIG
jgi:predicted nuclease of predicted toxin-antitoxin system